MKKKFEILTESEKIFLSLSEYIEDIKPEHFHRKFDNDWTVAENIVHLISSLKSSRTALLMPRIFLKNVFGKPKQNSRKYHELVNDYKAKLLEGSKASGKYIPSANTKNKHKKQLIKKWNRITKQYLDFITVFWQDDTMDKYQVPHPVLGLITIRELCYFNIYHTEHHLRSIRHRNIEAIEIPE